MLGASCEVSVKEKQSSTGVDRAIKTHAASFVKETYREGFINE
jgi:hypothetical protein